MKDFLIYVGIGIMIGGLIVGFWRSKIWPWVKNETTTVSSTVSSDAKAAAQNAAKIVSGAAKKI